MGTAAAAAITIVNGTVAARGAAREVVTVVIIRWRRRAAGRRIFRSVFLRMRGRVVTATLSEKLLAIDELMADAEYRLMDAELALREVEAARRGHAAKLSREDARIAHGQLEVLAEARSWLLGAQPQVVPAEPEKPANGGRNRGGRYPSTSGADRAPAGLQRAPAAWAEESEAP